MSIADYDALKQHFSSNEWPSFLSFEKKENSCLLSLDITPEIRWFEGHFPQQPVLAGVVQTHWAGELTRQVLAVEGDFQRIDNLKFQSVILPNMQVFLSLDHDSVKNAVKFRYYDDETTYSEGKLVFETQ